MKARLVEDKIDNKAIERLQLKSKFVIALSEMTSNIDKDKYKIVRRDLKKLDDILLKLENIV